MPQVKAEIVVAQAGNPAPGGYVSGSRDNLALGDEITLTNVDNTGAFGWEWQVFPSYGLTKTDYSITGANSTTCNLTAPDPGGGGDITVKLIVYGQPLPGGVVNRAEQEIVLGIRVPSAGYPAGIPVPHPRESNAGGAVVLDPVYGREIRIAEMAKVLSGVVGTGGPPSGPAGGDLDGTYPNPTVVATRVPLKNGTRIVVDADKDDLLEPWAELGHTAAYARVSLLNTSGYLDLHNVTIPGGIVPADTLQAFEWRTPTDDRGILVGTPAAAADIPGYTLHLFPGRGRGTGDPGHVKIWCAEVSPSGSDEQAYLDTPAIEVFSESGAAIVQIGYQIRPNVGAHSLTYINASGTLAAVSAGTTGYPLVQGATDPGYAQLGSAGIASGAVGNTQLASDAVTDVKVASGAAIAVAKLAPASAPRSVLASDSSTNAFTDSPTLVQLSIWDSAASAARLALQSPASGRLAYGNTSLTSASVLVSSSGAVYLTHGSADSLSISRSTNDLIVRVDAAATSLLFDQSSTTGATGATWKFKAQTSTHGSGVGGDLEAYSGAGSSAANAGKIKLFLGSSEALRALYSSGEARFGINNTSPAFALDVTGTVNASTDVRSPLFRAPSGSGFSTGRSTYSATGGSHTITTGEKETYLLEVTGTLTSDLTLTCPTGAGYRQRIANRTSGAYLFGVNCRRRPDDAADSVVYIPPGKSKEFFSDGTIIECDDPESFLFEVDVSLIHNNTTVDTDLVKLPAKIQVLWATVYIKTAVSGGTSTRRLGVSTGGVELLAEYTTGTADVVIGQSQSQLGTDMITDGNFPYPTAKTVSHRAATSSNITAGLDRVLIIGVVRV